ncbi:MAG: HAD family hydrolase [Desulfobacterales bacterium]|nr:HAD family hydrolase [Desulfobacterales bacterium]
MTYSHDVFAVDFDGVLCDSAAETGVTAWRAGGQVWPAWHGPEPPSEYLRRFINLRPVVETGYQAVLLMRLIYTGVEDETIELQFPELCTSLLDESEYSAADLVRLFSQARDTWIDRDLDDWLDRHRFYVGVVETFAARVESDPVFILTTKQERSVRILLHSRGIHLPADRIFGLDAGKSKENVLEQLSRRPEFDGNRFHFVEDRLQTLIRIAGRSSLRDVLLYLVDWGYNTPRDREKAKLIPRITIWDSCAFLDV